MNKNFERVEEGLLYGALALTMITLIFMFYSIAQPFKTGQTISADMPVHKSRMGMTSFDAQLAKEFMDKNNDGMCDFCGMRIEDCISSGMMQCTMDPNAKIGLLGSAHIHADFKVYVNGKEVNFANSEYYMKSMMIHLDDSPNKEDAASVLHMHATGIPLWMFFKSINMEIPDSVKLYSNGELNDEGLDYVFNGKDKLLLTDAAEENIIQQQIASITNYAQNH